MINPNHHGADCPLPRGGLRCTCVQVTPRGRYTAAEMAVLARQGYEFSDATDIRDSEPMFIVCGFRPLHESHDAPSPKDDPCR